MTGSVAPTGVMLVATGGFAGTLARYGVDLMLASSLAATLLVNVLGSFALAAIFFGNRENDALSRGATLVLATGFLSSFTTYSTFVIDAVLADPVVAGTYVLASYSLGFGGAVVGRVVGVHWLGTGVQ